MDKIFMQKIACPQQTWCDRGITKIPLNLLCQSMVNQMSGKFNGVNLAVYLWD